MSEQNNTTTHDIETKKYSIRQLLFSKKMHKRLQILEAMHIKFKQLIINKINYNLKHEI